MGRVGGLCFLRGFGGIKEDKNTNGQQRANQRDDKRDGSEQSKGYASLLVPGSSSGKVGGLSFN